MEWFFHFFLFLQSKIIKGRRTKLSLTQAAGPSQGFLGVNLWGSTVREPCEWPLWGSTVREYCEGNCEGTLWGGTVREPYEGTLWGSNVREQCEKTLWGTLWGSTVRDYCEGTLQGNTVRKLQNSTITVDSLLPTVWVSCRLGVFSPNYSNSGRADILYSTV